MNDTTRGIGGALGVAVLGSLVTTRFVAGLDQALTGLAADTHETARSGLAVALAVAARLPEPAGDGLAAAARAAFVDGIALASLTAVALGTAVAAYFLLPTSPTPGLAEPGPAPDGLTDRTPATTTPALVGSAAHPAPAATPVNTDRTREERTVEQLH